MILAKDKIYKVIKSFNALAEEDLERGHPEDLWTDLWTDRLMYSQELRKSNEIDIASVIDEVEVPVGLPDKIVMFGWFDLLQKTELPSNSLSWTIISKRFLDVVKQLGFTKYRLIPIRVIDHTPFEYLADEDVRNYENDLAVQGLTYDDDLFYGFQVLTRVQLLTDDSDFFEDRVVWRDKINPLELPYFFREPKSPGRLLVNQEARDALEAASIRGIRFIEPFGI
jgi:hypothetical protein